MLLLCGLEQPHGARRVGPGMPGGSGFTSPIPPKTGTTRNVFPLKRFWEFFPLTTNRSVALKWPQILISQVFGKTPTVPRIGNG